MDSINCPICSSRNINLQLQSKDYFVLDGRSEDFFIYFCHNCNNAFTYPFLTNRELSEYYPDDYECYSSHKNIFGKIQKLKSGNDVRIINNLLSAKNSSIFEIGAGSGFFLSLLNDKGFKVYGIEPSSAAIKYSKDNFNIDLEKYYFDDYDSEDKFDLILAFHVLEHFNDPEKAIKKIKKLLNENGKVFLKVPRLDSWASKLFGEFWHGYDVPRHRIHFTKKGLIYLLNKNGYKIELFKSDLGPLDTIRAIKYYSIYSSNGHKRKLFKVIDSAPYILKLIFAVIFEFIMFPFKPGRMSIIARKNK